jgi:Flp pilus assembly secretin CpaC
MAVGPMACTSIVSTGEDQEGSEKFPHLWPTKHHRSTQECEMAPVPREAPVMVHHSTQDTVSCRLRNIAAADAASIAKRFLEGNCLRVTLTTDPETNTIHVAGNPQQTDMVVGMLASLDEQPTQVQVEALVVQVPTGYLTTLGLTDDRLGAPVFKLTPRELDVLKMQLRQAKYWGTVEVLSHPTLQCRDNQPGFIWAGADCPELATRPAPGPGLAYSTEECTVVGVMLRLIPKIELEGNVLLRLEPIISIPNPKPVDPSSGYRPPTINVETESSTVLAAHGESVVLHGLSVPQLRASTKDGTIMRALTGKKSELLFILTPSVVHASALVVDRPDSTGR